LTDIIPPKTNVRIENLPQFSGVACAVAQVENYWLRHSESIGARSMKWIIGCRSMCGSACVAWGSSFPLSRWKATFALGTSGCRLAAHFMTIGTRMDSGGCTRFTGARSIRRCGFVGNGARCCSTTRRRWFAMTRPAPTGCRGTSSGPGSSPPLRRLSCGRSAWALGPGRCGSMRAGRTSGFAGTTRGW